MLIFLNFQKGQGRLPPLSPLVPPLVNCNETENFFLGTEFISASCNAKCNFHKSILNIFVFPKLDIPAKTNAVKGKFRRSYGILKDNFTA